MKAVIYLFTPQETDLMNRKATRTFLARAGAGRMFWETPEDDDVSYSIPFANFATMTKLLHLAYNNKLNFEKYGKATCKGFESAKENRRCLRIQLDECIPEYDPRRHANYIGKGDLDDGFSDESIGSLTLMDADFDSKVRKMFFSNFFDAGVIISKMYSKAVHSRVPLELSTAYEYLCGNKDV